MPSHLATLPVSRGLRTREFHLGTDMVSLRDSRAWTRAVWIRRVRAASIPGANGIRGVSGGDRRWIMSRINPYREPGVKVARQFPGGTAKSACLSTKGSRPYALWVGS